MALKEGSNANSFYKDTGIQITASFYDVYYDGGICALHRGRSLYGFRMRNDTGINRTAW